MTAANNCAAMQLIAQAVEDLVDGISADEEVITQAMSLALAKRVAGLCSGHADASWRAQEVARAIGAAVATFMNAKLQAP